MGAIPEQRAHSGHDRIPTPHKLYLFFETHHHVAIPLCFLKNRFCYAYVIFFERSLHFHSFFIQIISLSFFSTSWKEKMIAVLLTTLCSIATASAAASAAVQNVANKQPNVVLMFLDDWGWGDLGANWEAAKGMTPHMDLIAEEGIR